MKQNMDLHGVSIRIIASSKKITEGCSYGTFRYQELNIADTQPIRLETYSNSVAVSYLEVEIFKGHDITSRSQLLRRRRIHHGASSEGRKKVPPETEAVWRREMKNWDGGHLEKVTSRQAARATASAIFKGWRHGRRQWEIAVTSWKTAVADDDDCLCEVRTTDVLQSHLTPTMLSDSQILEKGYIWGIKQVLRGDGGLVETQLGCEHHRPGSNPTPTWPVVCSSARKLLIGIRAWLMTIESQPFLLLLQDPGPDDHTKLFRPYGRCPGDSIVWSHV